MLGGIKRTAGAEVLLEGVLPEIFEPVDAGMAVSDMPVDLRGQSARKEVFAEKTFGFQYAVTN